MKTKLIILEQSFNLPCLVRKATKFISIVVPAYNEEVCSPTLALHAGPATHFHHRIFFPFLFVQSRLEAMLNDTMAYLVTRQAEEPDYSFEVGFLYKK